MLRYIAKRVLSAIITIWFIMTLTFILMNAIPGDPFASEKMNDPVIIANMKAKYGLDKEYGNPAEIISLVVIPFFIKEIPKSPCI